MGGPTSQPSPSPEVRNLPVWPRLSRSGPGPGPRRSSSGETLYVSQLAIGACVYLLPRCQAGRLPFSDRPIPRCHPCRVPSLPRGLYRASGPVRRPTAAPRGVRSGPRFGPFLSPPWRPSRGRGAIGVNREMTPRTGSALVEGLVSSPSTQPAVRPRLQGDPPKS